MRQTIATIKWQNLMCFWSKVINSMAILMAPFIHLKFGCCQFQCHWTNFRLPSCISISIRNPVVDLVWEIAYTLSKDMKSIFCSLNMKCCILDVSQCWSTTNWIDRMAFEPTIDIYYFVQIDPLHAQSFRIECFILLHHR